MEQSSSAAKFAFYYMLSLVALIISAIATITVGFQIINKHVPDVLNQFSGIYNDDALKMAISALIITVPIFYVLTRLIQKNLYSGALPKESGVRKWLTYFILLVSAVVMIIWLIMTINSFLDGELTSKFILKALTAIFVSAAIFTFYFYDIKRSEVVGQKSQIVKFYFYGSLSLVFIAFIAALFNVESPTQARNRKFDVAVLERFNSIDSAITQHYNDNKKMPSSLEDLKKDFNYITDEALTNPFTGKEFNYRVTEDKKYELCTDFKGTNLLEKNRIYYDMKDRWPHDAGYQCIGQKIFTFDNDKNIAPVPAPIR